MEFDPSSSTPESRVGLSTLPIPTVRKPPFTLLIVDDDADLRLLLRLALADEPYTIYEAANGEMALKMCLDLKPELILLDIALPAMDGISVLQQVRQVNQTVSILMVSALHVEKWILAAIENGADGFIAKPLNITTLRRLVAQQVTNGRQPC